MNKLTVKVFLKGTKENWCPKCGKTKDLIEKMMQEELKLKDRVNVLYDDATSKETIEIYGELNPPVIFINDRTFSEGQVPIKNKLKQAILESV
ncbi:MAG: thioredoxin family protein [Promethearchaeota archaeon]|jgi:glutaredoxin-related protein